MSTGEGPSGVATGTAPDPDEVEPAELATRVAVLREENERLRAEFTRARRARYRRTAVALAAVGVVGLLAGFLFPDVREVLLALGATGVFAGLLTYYLAPERFLPASAAGAIYEALAENETGLVATLGLGDTRLYLPRTDGRDDPRLFVPQRSDYAIPDDDDLEGTLVVPDDERRRGVSLSPTGGPLLREFERELSGSLASDPETLAGQLSDGVSEGLELVESATPDVDPGGERLSVGVAGSALGPVDRFDHPVASFLAVGVATGLSRPVEVGVTAGDDRYDYVVTCTWTVPE